MQIQNNRLPVAPAIAAPDPETIRAIVVGRLIRSRGLTPAVASVVAGLAGLGPSSREARR